MGLAGQRDLGKKYISRIASPVDASTILEVFRFGDVHLPLLGWLTTSRYLDPSGTYRL